MKRQSIDSKGINKESSAACKNKIYWQWLQNQSPTWCIKTIDSLQSMLKPTHSFVMKPFVTTITLSNDSGNLQFTIKTDEWNWWLASRRDAAFLIEHGIFIASHRSVNITYAQNWNWLRNPGIARQSMDS